MDRGPIQRWEQTYQKILFIPGTSTRGLLQIFEKEVQVGQTLSAGCQPLPAFHIRRKEDWESSLQECGWSLLSGKSFHCTENHCNIPSLPPRALNLSCKPGPQSSRHAHMELNTLLLASDGNWSLLMLRMPSSLVLHLMYVILSAAFVCHLTKAHVHFHIFPSFSSPHPSHQYLPYLPEILAKASQLAARGLAQTPHKKPLAEMTYALSSGSSCR